MPVQIGSTYHDYSISDAYLLYKKKCDKKSIEPVSKVQYLKICCEYNKEMVNEALNGSMVHMPFDIGTIWVRKKQMTFLKPQLDYKYYNEHGVKLYHMNDHSDGYTCAIKWNRLVRKTTNMKFYRFTPTRVFKRTLASIMKIKNGHKRFFK